MGAEDVPCLRLGVSRSEVRSGMTCHLLALCFDANDPLRLARFWAGVLGWEMADDSGDGVSLVPGDDTGLRIRFLPAQETKPGLNPGHPHLTSTSLEAQQQT